MRPLECEVALLHVFVCLFRELISRREDHKVGKKFKWSERVFRQYGSSVLSLASNFLPSVQ